MAYFKKKIVIYKDNFTSEKAYNEHIDNLIRSKELEGYNEIKTNTFKDYTEIIY
jgi:hypothetical protein